MYVTLSRHIAVLSRLLFQGYDVGDFNAPKANLEPVYPDLDYVAKLEPAGLQDFLRTANTHHVIVRGLSVLRQAASFRKYDSVVAWCDTELAKEQGRIALAVNSLAPICAELERAGCPVAVIKSLDHWPDLGSDLDLYTSGDPATVREVMQATFHAKLEERSWGDRLAHKWNFSVPGLPELIEIHVQYLGQTGEHKAIARRVIERSQLRRVLDHDFPVPAPEERIVISTLQRMYRHFYFRLCDMADIANLLEQREVNFAELRKAADSGGIWSGVATFLHLVSKYVQAYGRAIDLPQSVLDAAHSPAMTVQLRGDFLRVPLLPSAGLYGSQLLSAGVHGDLRAMCRLPLLPPLAITALLAFRLTGTDKGIW
jgi:hypothetical protein